LGAISISGTHNSGVRQVPGGGYEPKRGAAMLPFKIFGDILSGFLRDQQALKNTFFSVLMNSNSFGSSRK
jgi:hypothetical protein